MELVYLWVEEYKNIHKQGFNFSPRFSCKYDDVKNELTIKENDNYIENFFGENINVTAIVGKNGSGKSSVLEIIEQIYGASNNQDINYILCFILNNEKYIYSNIQVQANNFIKKERLEDNLLTYQAEMPYRYFSDRGNQFEHRWTISFESKNIARLITKYLNDNFELTTFILIPKIIYIRQDENYLNDLIGSIAPVSAVRSFNPENGVPFEDCHDDREMYTTDNSLEAFFFLRIINNELSDYLCSENFYNPQHLNYDSSVLEKFYNKKEFELNEEDYTFEEYNYIIEKYKFDKDTLNENDSTLIEKYSDFFSFDYEDDLGRRYKDLSHGEKSIFGQFINIYDKIKSDNNDFLIILDEPDLALHPNWQKKYISELDTFFNFNKSIHFVCMTHSPFLLSDIPKQNIIFLDKYKEEDKEVKDGKQKIGNCKVLTHKKVFEQKQTFGANIHTLLSDSFFMEDGLMGEFAKGKINDVYNFIVNNETDKIKTKEEAQQIINIIGDALIKRQLEELYHQKFKEPSKDEIIELLRKEIETLKANNDSD